MKSWVNEIVERLERIERHLSEQSFKPMSVQEAAAYLHISKSGVYRLTSQGLVGHYKPSGKKLYFDKKDLDSWVRKNRVASPEEIEEMAKQHMALLKAKREAKYGPDRPFPR